MWGHWGVGSPRPPWPGNGEACSLFSELSVSVHLQPQALSHSVPPCAHLIRWKLHTRAGESGKKWATPGKHFELLEGIKLGLV